MDQDEEEREQTPEQRRVERERLYAEYVAMIRYLVTRPESKGEFGTVENLTHHLANAWVDLHYYELGSNKLSEIISDYTRCDQLVEAMQAKYGENLDSIRLLERFVNVTGSKGSVSKRIKQLQAAGQEIAKLDRQNIAKNAARAALEKNPEKQGKVKAKAFVKECWHAWNAKPEQYKSIAAFAAAMLDKKEELTNPAVIQRWVRAWRTEFQENEK